MVDESLPQYLGTAALTTGDYIHEAIAKSDLIISVGYDPIEKPTSLMGTGGTPNIHVNFYEAAIDEVYTPYMEVIGDIGNTFWQLSQSQLDGKNWKFDEVYSIKDNYLKKRAENLQKEDMGEDIM